MDSDIRHLPPEERRRHYAQDSLVRGDQLNLLNQLEDGPVAEDMTHRLYAQYAENFPDHLKRAIKGVYQKTDDEKDDELIEKYRPKNLWPQGERITADKIAATRNLLKQVVDLISQEQGTNSR